MRSLELWIAWRHLRSREGRRWLIPVGLLAIYVTLVGAGFLLWASIRGDVSDLAGVPTADAFIPPVADLARLCGLVTLGLGLLVLVFAVLSALFNLLSAIVTLSVAQGCMALVVVLSLMTGLELDLREKIVEQRAEIRIARLDGDAFDDHEALLVAVRGLAEVADASAIVEGEVMVRSPYNRQGALLVGIEPEHHRHVTALATMIQSGDYGFLIDPESGPWEAIDRLQEARDAASRAGLASTSDATTTDATTTDTTTADTTGGDDEDTDAWESAGEAKERPAVVDEFIADEADADAWEDPSNEIAKLRASGELPPPRDAASDPAFDAFAADEADADAWEDPSREIAKLRASGELPPPKDAAVDPAFDAFAADEAAEAAWEEPSREIAKMRASGELPPPRAPASPEDVDPTGEVGSPEGSTNDPIAAAEPGERGGDPPNPAEPPSGPGYSREQSQPDDAAEGSSAVIYTPILLGLELADELGIGVGGRLQLITPIGRMTPAGQVPSVLAVRAVGVFFSGMFAYDHRNVYAPLDRVQALLRLGGRIHAIDVKLRDGDRLEEGVEALRRVVAASSRPELAVQSWKVLNHNLFSAMFLEKVAMFVGLLFVVLVAAAGILATNLISVLDKAQEIAILKAMGASDRRISRVFMIEGLVVGLIGSVLGIGAGLLFCGLLASQGLPLSADNFYVQRLPVVVSPGEVLAVGVAALAIVWLSSVHPARRAARLRPTQGLRSTE